MSQDDPELDENRPHRPARRAYEAPAVVDSAVFETLALTCGKTTSETTCTDFLGTTNS